jgi:hypothetical protein
MLRVVSSRDITRNSATHVTWAIEVTLTTSKTRRDKTAQTKSSICCNDGDVIFLEEQEQEAEELKSNKYLATP